MELRKHEDLEDISDPSTSSWWSINSLIRDLTSLWETNFIILMMSTRCTMKYLNYSSYSAELRWNSKPPVHAVHPLQEKPELSRVTENENLRPSRKRVERRMNGYYRWWTLCNKFSQLFFHPYTNENWLAHARTEAGENEEKSVCTMTQKRRHIMSAGLHESRWNDSCWIKFNTRLTHFSRLEHITSWDWREEERWCGAGGQKNRQMHTPSDRLEARKIKIYGRARSNSVKFLQRCCLSVRLPPSPGPNEQQKNCHESLKKGISNSSGSVWTRARYEKLHCFWHETIIALMRRRGAASTTMGMMHTLHFIKYILLHTLSLVACALKIVHRKIKLRRATKQ